MLAVVDVGCARYGGDYSLERLAEEFRPDIIYGFDPMWDAKTMTVPAGIPARIYDAVAWTEDGTMPFQRDGLNSCVSRAGAPVKALDLGALLEGLSPNRIVLKLDCEGSEYDLLPDLIERDLDSQLELLLVEWHCLDCGRGGAGHRPGCPEPVNTQRQKIAAALRCDVREWLW